MNWHSQLTKLIFDFYREDPLQLQQLRTLRSCKLSRRWGILRISCRDRATAEALTTAGEVLSEPIAQLRLAREIRLFTDGMLVATLTVGAPKLLR